jgi:3-deoxy-manno-octulosonate cytidylyltransferase (CMP-KDO synthetase)
MSFVVIIPARLASTRLPNKPLADLGGKPMIVQVARRMFDSGASQVMVATDHDAIASVCTQHGIDVHMTHIDHQSGTDRIAEVAAKINLAADTVVVNVQGDEPLLPPKIVSATAALINDNVPMATAAHAIDEISELFNPNFVKVVLDNQNRALYFSRAPIPWDRNAYGELSSTLAKQAASEAGSEASLLSTLPLANRPLRHIGLYAYRNDFLQSYSTLTPAPLEKIEALEQLRALWHGFPIAVHISNMAPPAGVDTPDDLKRVQAIFSGTST